MKKIYISGLPLFRVQEKNTKLHISYYRTEGLLWVISCLTSAVLTSFFWTGAIRFALRLLFTYQGWMFLSRDGWKKPSILLKMWLVTLQALCYLRHLGSKTKSGKPLLLAFQGSLPTLPLPSVKETVQR